ncbi:NAD(P)H nitroreductase [Aeromonas popoffii]|uniref:NAD(P)H nitroreductase n=1 Tax=Aeromonas popoffii TaxID=70856 RepID=UPI0030CF5EF2
MDALTLLLNRHSCGRLADPAPSGEVLDNILKAGLRAPDHGTLTPWQFILFEGEGRERLGNLLAEAARARGEDDDSVKKCSEAPLRAPLLVAVATRYQAHPKVPKLEQELSAGCALMAMQMAAQAQGFNGIWRSGWFIFDERVNEGLGLAPEDQLVGFLYLGTPMLEARKLRELPPDEFVRRF